MLEFPEAPDRKLLIASIASSGLAYTEADFCLLFRFTEAQNETFIQELMDQRILRQMFDMESGREYLVPMTHDAKEDDALVPLTTPKRLCTGSQNFILKERELTQTLRQLQGRLRHADHIEVLMKKNELEALGDLAEKWQDAALVAFQHISTIWQEPLSMTDMLHAAGFDSDLLDSEAMEEVSEYQLGGELITESDSLYCSSCITETRSSEGEESSIKANDSRSQ